MTPRRVALWRYEQIEDLLDGSLSPPERRALLLRLTRVPVRWPSGADRPLSEATLYRWARAYGKKGLKGLYPSPRRDRGRRRRLSRKSLERAVALLREEPRRSLFMLRSLLRTLWGVHVSRSTLHRHLKRHRAYARLRRLARGAEVKGRLRRRFESGSPHDLWQTDSKGPFLVRFRGSRRLVAVHVMTILDDFSRATLAAAVVEKADHAAAVKVFRAAARRYGLPRRFYADRAAIFDSKAFREGLAELGVTRINTRPGNAPAHGKIEAYHRVLGSWFINELRHQIVQNLDHLNRLLVGMLETLYMDHRHGTLRKTPRQALGEAISPRQVSSERLHEAFLLRLVKKSHPKTGEVDLPGGLFKVPSPLAGHRVQLAYDPEDLSSAFLESEDGSRKRLAFAIDPRPTKARSESSPPEPRGEGRLQALYDAWQGRKLPISEPGFGLPEIFALLGRSLSRRVPRDEAEARLIQDFYRAHGPLARVQTEAAFRKIAASLGPGRPLATYLHALASRIVPRTDPRDPE